MKIGLYKCAGVLFVFTFLAQTALGGFADPSASWDVYNGGASTGENIPGSASDSGVSGSYYFLAALGADPTLTTTLSVTANCNTYPLQDCGGSAAGDIFYQFEVVGGTGTNPVAVQMVADSMIDAPTQSGYAALDIYSSTIVYSMQDCGPVNGSVNADCRANNGFPLGHIVPATLNLETNTIYTVEMQISLVNNVLGSTMSVTLDPEFFLAQGSPDTIEYANGVSQASSATPEPATWFLLGAGLMLIWAFQKRRAGIRLQRL